MNQITTNIDICIATYQRSIGLKKLLNSIVNQSCNGHIKINVIVIDNDPKKSAHPVVEAVFKNSGISYIYDMQPEKNIALTRNKALAHALAEYIIFVDDDEWVLGDWLINLLTISKQYKADVVFGPVIPEFSSDTPKWIIEGGFFDCGASKTGDLRRHGATNNTLVHNSAKIKQHLQFDPEFGLTGGSDTELFHRLHINGAKLIWCNEAPVYEHVPPERLSVEWLLKRSFRSGQNCARIFHKNQSFRKKTISYLFRASYLLLAILLLPLSFPFGKKRWVWVLRKLVANAGQLSTLFTKYRYQEYK